VDKDLADRNTGLFKAIYSKRGEKRFRQTSYDDAISDFRDALRLAPKDFNAQFHLAQAWLAKSDYDKAIKEFTTALELDPNATDAYFYRGRARTSKTAYAEAIKDFKIVLKREPKHARALAYLGYSRICNGENEGMEDCNKAIELDKSNAELYYVRGLAYGELNDPKQAIKNYDKAIDLDKSPDHWWKARAYLKGSKCYRQLSDEHPVAARKVELFNRSERYRESALKLDPSLKGK
jgi:tetratricopeptide (TPR) repeat protein